MSSGSALKLPRLYAIADRETLDRRGMSVAAFAEELREAGVRLVQYRDKVGGPQEVLRAAREMAEVFEGVGATLILNDRADLAALLGWGVHVGQRDLSVEDAVRVVQAHPSYKADGWATCWVGVSTHTVEEVMAADEDVRLQPMSQKRDMGHPAADEDVTLQPMSQKRDMGHPAADEDVRLRPMSQKRDMGHPATDEDVRLRPMSQKRDMGHPAADEDVTLQPMSQKRDMGHPDGARYIAIGPVFGTVTKVDAEAVVGLEGVRAARALTERPLVAIGGITLENCRSVVEAGADSVAVISGMFVAGRTVRAVAEDFLERMR